MTRGRSGTICEWALRLAHWLDRPPRWLGAGGAWLLPPMVAVIVYDVIGRRYIRHLDIVVDNDLHHFINSPKLQDSEWHFSAALILLALGYAFSRNVHIRLDILRHRYSPRAKVAIELAGSLLLLPFLAVLLFHAWDFVAAAWVSDEQSMSTTGLDHRWAIKSALLIGLGSLAMAALSLSLRAAVWLFGPAALAERAGLDGLVRERASGDDPTRPQSS